MTLLTLDGIERIATDSLVACGASRDNAASVARSVRRAEADDISSVGLGYLPTYLRHLRNARVDGRAVPVVERSRPASIQVHAAGGFAHPAFDAGRPPLVEAARALGCAGLAIHHSYSIGVLGHPVEDIAEAGLIALAFSNSPPNMAPWGGKRPLFGTNPLAFAAPRPSRAPLIVDLATTAVTKVTLMAAVKRGEPFPPGWALDGEGHPTTDPAAAARGSLAPFGGAKGAALALVVEVLAAALTGARLSRNVVPYARPDGPPPGVGQFILAIDPGAFSASFAASLDELTSAILDDSGARLAGDRRLRARDAAERIGVEVDPDLLATIRNLAESG